ncbi:hypothetical protein CesoFtcFv8_001980 [Champsocephalus esox]|uniref:Uncharacterized protein n=2 Tax=Champsocephalus TaxID=52236 RepID=A0AAN8E4H1_CHAGU|nr:hypothetical protein CesoFtcFv8_001980 [Champsocephalus esox]KAK5933565.1 hypothetical protein CgunFtcFv8_014036 [Champsocephalus gunnari]
MEGRGERIEPGHEQESFIRRVGGEFQHRRTSHKVREGEKGTSKDSGQRDANGKSMEDKNSSKGTVNKRESLLHFKDLWSRKGSVVSPREAKGREDTFAHSKEVSSREDFVASINGSPGTPQSPKGPIIPGPWKVPSSARILTEAEVLQDPL